MTGAFVSAFSTESPWFYVLCGVILLVGIAVVIYCLLRRPRFTDSAAATPDALVGKTGVVTEEVDTEAGTGLVTIDGEGWAARTVYIDDVYAAGTQVQVVAIEGVKLIVKPIE